jgi:hypothetical protein
MKTTLRSVFVTLFISLFTVSVLSAGFKDWSSKALSVFDKTTDAEAVAGSAFSSAEDLATALREALAVSAERALKDLSKKGGFANSELYKIPLPKTIESLRKPLQLVNREDLLNDF